MFQDANQRLVQFRRRHSDGVWTPIDSSSWQLPGFLLWVLWSQKQEGVGDLKYSLGRDQTGSHFSPHKYKLAENKATTEKQASFKARNIPLCSQKRWKLYFWHYNRKFFTFTWKKSSTGLWLILTGYECFSFTLARLSWRPKDARLNCCFVSLLWYTSFCLSIALCG